MTEPTAGPWKRAFRRLRANTPAIVSACLLLAIVLVAFSVPEFLPKHLERPSDQQFAPPSAQHWFGTDLNGRDIFYRVLIGARISLIVGCAGALVSLFIGTTVGLISGYFGGWVDNTLMRLVDILYAVPRLLFIIIFVNIAKKPFTDWIYKTFDVDWMVSYAEIGLLIISLGFIEWLTMSRIVRGQVLALKSLQFVTAAKTLGQSNLRILLKHLLPNVTGVILAYLTLIIPAVMLDEAFLSFLGLGVSASEASWGTLLSDGAQAINPVYIQWWLIVFPGVAMSVTLLALNFLGDGLRDALDPRK